MLSWLFCRICVSFLSSAMFAVLALFPSYYIHIWQNIVSQLNCVSIIIETAHTQVDLACFRMLMCISWKGYLKSQGDAHRSAAVT